MRILGHRGASADHPENTIEAFLGAMEQGADGVELDVMRCGSGELVVCHDERLDRLAGLELEVARERWGRLKTVDVGSRLGFRPARLALLEDVVDALPSRAFFNIELKVKGLDDGGLAEAVGALVARRGLLERSVVSSFSAASLVRLATSAPRVRRGLLIDPERPWIPQAWLGLVLTAPASVHPSWRQVTPARVARWHSAHLELAVWTVDDVDEARRLRAMGVEWLITNRPGALQAELRSAPWAATLLGGTGRLPPPPRR